jgi:hypothetical protein
LLEKRTEDGSTATTGGAASARAEVRAASIGGVAQTSLAARATVITSLLGGSAVGEVAEAIAAWSW